MIHTHEDPDQPDQFLPTHLTVDHGSDLPQGYTPPLEQLRSYHRSLHHVEQLEHARPTRDQTLMEVAHTMAKRGTCSRAAVGVVVAHNGRILVTGYNGAPAGMPHCRHTEGNIPCTIAVHGEANAIAYAARYGISLEGASLYTTLSPCQACSQLIINAGIVEVIFADQYRAASGMILLDKAGIITRAFRG